MDARVMRTWRLALICAATTAACSSGAAKAPPAQPNATTAAAGAPAYAPARWRLAQQAELRRTIVWLEHIVVAHRDSQPGATKFRPLGWAPDPKNPERSKAEALARARHVLQLARTGASGFEDLARQYSDDVVTREAGGALGGVRAFALPSAYLDALAVMRPGEVSDVFETPFGYHLIKRLPIAPGEHVAGRRILVRYQGVWPVPGRAPSPRTRAAARAIAREIAAQAQSGAASFDELIAKHSEAGDDGDFGIWSLRDPEDSGRELDALMKLRVGAISAPLDSPGGVEILQRTAADERPQYAMIGLGLSYDGSAPEADTHSRRRMHDKAVELSRGLAEDPTAFEALIHAHCCEEPRRWTAGREAPSLTAAVEALRIGEIAKQPVEADGFFWIPKRLDPATLSPPEPALYELPSPSAPDLEAIIRASQGDALAAEVKSLSQILHDGLGLDPKSEQAVREVLARLSVAFAQGRDPLARLECWHVALSDVRTALGPARYIGFESLLQNWAARRIMDEAR